MFGEYGVYVDGKMIGSVCDDQLFVKPTASGRVHAEPVSDAPPYPGAKPQMLIEADRWDDAEWLSELLRVTAAELPAAKPRNRSGARKQPRRNDPFPDVRVATHASQLPLFVHCSQTNILAQGIWELKGTT
ncbi:TfoX/Sxy family protein [Sphingomonas profundi]|uniref:TfoX/Sxy family protein n=1 Tax=Alterirhizorhabdus profundi TaxID=2681549 RepID=UPI0018D16799|nr:TfoX/Sxy family protein [Sphingomonas profundi]